MVEFIDGTFKFVGFLPDMKFPINYILNYPERFDAGLQEINFSKINKLNFKSVDKNSEWIKLAREAIRKKGSFPVVLNGANEMVVECFLNGKIKFREIIKIIEKVLEKHEYKEKITFEEIFYYHNWAGKEVEKIIEEIK